MSTGGSADLGVGSEGKRFQLSDCHSFEGWVGREATPSWLVAALKTQGGGERVTLTCRRSPENRGGRGRRAICFQTRYFLARNKPRHLCTEGWPARQRLAFVNGLRSSGFSNGNKRGARHERLRNKGCRIAGALYRVCVPYLIL